MVTREHRRSRRIPAFASIEEEAAFWDSYDLGEFEDDLEPVEFQVAQPLGHILEVRLESEAFRRLCRVAKERKVDILTLAETWVLEGLDRAESSSG